MDTSHREVVRLGPYLLLRLVGCGSVAEVYRAVPASPVGLERSLAVKIVLPSFAENSAFAAAWLEAASAATALSHPNAVRTFEANAVGEAVYAATEWVAGVPLAEVARRQALKASASGGCVGLPVAFAVEIALGAAGALAAAHALKTGPRSGPLLHRDVSPFSIMVDWLGTPRLTDFGAAAAKSQLTHTMGGVAPMRATYTSPEQVSGETLDGRSDIFALGTVLWEMLAGQSLFTGRNDFETIRNVLQAPIPALRPLNPDVPAELEAIAARCLARKPSERFVSAGELHRELQRFANEQSLDLRGQAELLMQSLFADDIETDKSRQAEDESLADAVRQGQRSALSVVERAAVMQPAAPAPEVNDFESDEVTRPWRARRTLGIDQGGDQTGEMPALKVEDFGGSSEAATREINISESRTGAPDDGQFTPPGGTKLPAPAPQAPLPAATRPQPPLAAPAPSPQQATSGPPWLAIGIGIGVLAMLALAWLVWRSS